MKKMFLPILLMHLAIVVNAAKYYFSSVSGDDSRTSAQAQSTKTPWQSITKLNAIMSTLQPGDQVLFKRGETFYGAIVLTTSGTSGNPITFSAYGSGVKPVITGFTNVTGWSQVRTNVWEAPFTAGVTSEGMVVMNDQQQGIGRYPNKDAANGGYLTINSHSGTTELTSSQLPSAPNWTGADIAIRKTRWVIDRSTVTYHYGTTIGFTGNSTFGITDKFGFFIVNSTNTLDKNGEWFYDKARNKMQMYFSNNNPNASTVKASSVETLVNIAFQKYVSFTNLSFTGANTNVLKLTNSDYITVNNCDLKFIGVDGVNALSSYYFTLTNSAISNVNSNGIYLYWNCSYANISNNSVKNIAIIPGMNRNGTDVFQGLHIRGDYDTIQYNRVDSTGASGIHFEGDYSTVANNFVNTFGFVVDDCGGIYTGQGMGDNTVYHSKSILNNIVINGIGATAGTDDTTYLAVQGIYLDNNTNHVLVSGNTVANCGQAGIFSNENNYVTFTNNTMFNNGKEQFLGTKHKTMGSVSVKNNIMFSKTATQLGTKIASHTGNSDVAQFGSFDSNYYCRPIDNNYLFFAEYYVGSTYNSSFENLVNWNAKYGYDKNSKGAPATIPAYTYSTPGGGNKYTNGAYNTSVSDVGTFASNGDISRVWNANKLDAGTMEVSSKSYPSNNNYMLTLPLNSDVKQNQSYMLTFTLQGSTSGRPMDVYMRTRTTGNADLTTHTKIPIDIKRNEIQIPMTASASSNASIQLDVAAPNGTIWVDNVNLQEATITPVNLDNYMIFKYNPSTTNKKFSVSGTYYDAKGNTYSGQITLAPYTSIVLFKKDGTTSTFKTSTEAQAIQLQGTMTDASAASFTTSSVANVNWQVDNQSSTASYYTVERSADAANFVFLGKTATKKAEGSSLNYVYNDATPTVGKNWYRITQYDEKSVAGISKTTMVNNLSFQVNPNPVQSTMHLIFNGTLKAEDHIGKDVVISSLSGATIKTLQLPSTSGINVASLNVASLQSGMYILSISAEGKIISKKFLKQ